MPFSERALHTDPLTHTYCAEIMAQEAACPPPQRAQKNRSNNTPFLCRTQYRAPRVIYNVLGTPFLDNTLIPRCLRRTMLLRQKTLPVLWSSCSHFFLLPNSRTSWIQIETAYKLQYVAYRRVYNKSAPPPPKSHCNIDVMFSVPSSIKKTFFRLVYRHRAMVEANGDRELYNGCRRYNFGYDGSART